MTTDTKRHTLIAVLALLAQWMGSSTAHAQQPPVVYYISMRGLQTEAVASFVVVVRAATAERATAVAGCDGRTYYATAADAAAISAARAAGELVQLHRGREGEAPGTTPIRCILDASGP